ncbi:hypothetical protein J2S40_004369 [Nocardioides luteus]|uniref:Uncharacterized protein n=1 Tax=Nocardioides luteus TaxID=1844 RepID=A0ABQ5ST48_9ACTN|nr:hypothetical protein [Nocardioides luteus]MDR7313311.1 hypothetical protein [Nocardioides luteus]GGR60162.1 hypothetical protein GCM10010197_28740 [Nocardioides luteus]GLJ66376.1 hypothetical protein GCM10017579_04120 [Nocardioides luteus]
MTTPPKGVMAWAEKADSAREEWARHSVDAWASTARFAQPMNWGDAESAVLERQYPPLPGTLAVRTVGIVAVVFMVFLALPLFGAPLFGLTLLAIAAGRDAGGEGLLWFARIAFGVATLMGLIMISAWWETRRRSVVSVATAAVCVVASGASYVLIRLANVAGIPWLSVLVLAAAVVGLVCLALELMSKPEGRAKSRKPPKRGPRSSDKRARAKAARDRLLEILVRRRLVDLDEGDQIRLREMPLGYWCELDGLDEREWRRVLEYRHVGWREFDASDKWVY